MDSSLPRRQRSANFSSLDDLRDLGLLNLLEHDPRPTIVIEREVLSDGQSTLEDRFVYNNHALLSVGLSRDLIAGIHDARLTAGLDTASLSEFRDWCFGQNPSDMASMNLNGFKWTRYTVADRWSVINGTSPDAVGQVAESAAGTESSHNTTSRSDSKTSEQTKVSLQEAYQGHLKFQRFAERSNIGISIMDASGIFSYRNEAWYTILKPDDRDIELDEAWEALLDDGDIGPAQAKLAELFKTKEPQTFELRLKSTWSVPDSRTRDGGVSELQHKWVICSIFPELSPTGEILEIIGSLTDVSQQKWAEHVQATQAMRARESKQQLENFIDTTSHEMRNPLSAIVQCADSIISSQNTLRSLTQCDDAYQNVLSSTIETADTIVQCSKHMKIIVDDVLTMSKLDSGLFTMTPIDVSLESTVKDAIKMFEREAESAGVGLQLHIDDSCKQLGITKVSIDPNRVLQVLINLLTNAIKFTRLEHQKRIQVSLSVSLERPSQDSDGRVKYMPRSEQRVATTLEADWKQGQAVFICLSVADTGAGMTEAEHERLFLRFSQTNPRTHIDYGGSGLGLFISRRLTEMHGGAIGFTSQEGHGSTFSFYVQGRKSQSYPAGEENGLKMTTKLQQSLGSNNNMSCKSDLQKESNSPRPDADTPNDNIDDSALHILVVEDNLVNQRVLAKQLRNLGIQVTVANHGGEALKHLQTTKYWKGIQSSIDLTVILMDWEMPITNGLECVQEIRRLQQQGVIEGHVPVIAVTANVRLEQIEVARKAGMDNVVSKPFRIPELRACIQETLKRRAAMVAS